MYLPLMEYGEERVTPVEGILQSLQLRVVVSRRLSLSEWSFELSSPFWRLYANDRSGGFLKTKDRTYELKADSVYLIPSWVEFKTGLHRPLTHDFIHFYLTGFPVSLHNRLFSRPIELPSDPLLKALRERWSRSLAEGAPRDWAGFGWASALANAALSTVASQLDPSDRGACFQWITQAKEVRPALLEIEKHMAEPPSNDRLANVCSLSTSHFVRIFQRAIGLTPARYGLERRLAVAAGALVHSPRPIEAVAAATGFTDRFHFSRAFKTRFGVAPAAYRKMHQHGI